MREAGRAPIIVRAQPPPPPPPASSRLERGWIALARRARGCRRGHSVGNTVAFQPLVSVALLCATELAILAFAAAANLTATLE